MRIAILRYLKPVQGVFFHIFPFIFLILFWGSAWGAFKAAYIDMQRAVQSTSLGKKAKTKLEKKLLKKQKELQKKEKQWVTQAEAFEKKREVYSPKVRKDKEEALRLKRMEIQKDFQAFQMNMQREERQLMGPIIESLGRAIEQVASEKKYSMVFEKSQGVLWASKGLDITQEVLAIHKKNQKKNGKK